MFSYGLPEDLLSKGQKTHIGWKFEKCLLKSFFFSHNFTTHLREHDKNIVLKEKKKLPRANLFCANSIKKNKGDKLFKVYYSGIEGEM